MTEEEEPRKGSGCAAVMVVMVFTAVPMVILWLVSREAFILFVGAIAWGAIIWAARTKASWVLDAPNPSPTEGPDPSPDANVQVKYTKDLDHPSRWEVVVDQGKQG